MKMLDFAQEADLPVDNKGKPESGLTESYFRYQLLTEQNTNYVQLVTISEEFWKEFSLFTEESKRKFILTALNNAIQAQSGGQMFYIESSEDKLADILITMSQWGSEFFLHVSTR